MAQAAAGLGALGDLGAVDPLTQLLDLDRRHPLVVATALRALGNLSDPKSTASLREFVLTRGLAPTLRMEAVSALSGREGADTEAIFIELMTSSWPPLRAAALRALAETDSESLMLVSIRSRSRSRTGVGEPLWPEALEQAEPSAATLRLIAMQDDDDQRVVPSVLSALVAVDAPGIDGLLISHLQAEDIVVRKTAAMLLGGLGSLGAAEPLRQAYRDAATEPGYLARAAIVDALADIGGPVAEEVLLQALDDADWAVQGAGRSGA